MEQTVCAARRRKSRSRRRKRDTEKENYSRKYGNDGTPRGRKKGEKKGRMDETNEAQRQKSVNASGVSLLKKKLVER